MKQTTIFEDINDQDGGILLAIYANSLAIATIALNDNSISEESKLVIEQLKIQTQALFRAGETEIVLPEEKKFFESLNVTQPK